MGYPVKVSSTAQPLVFLMVLSSDHLTGATGLSPTVKLSKAGAAGAAPAGAVSEIDATNMPGWYKVAGNATDSGTLGPLALHASAATADPVDELYHVVAYDPQIATNLGLSGLPTANPGAANGVLIAGTNAATTITSSTGDALTLSSTGGNGSGLVTTGNGSGSGHKATGGATGNGATYTGGSGSGHATAFLTTSGDGMHLAPTAGHGISSAANGLDKHGIVASGGAGGTGDGIKAVAGSGVPIRGDLYGDIHGALIGSAAGLTGLSATVTAIGSGAITAGSFAAGAIDAAAFAQAAADRVWSSGTRTLSAFGFSVTVGTNNDKTGYALTVAPPTAAAIATAVWTDTTSGDFTTAGSPGLVVVTRLGNTLQSAGGANYQFTTTALALAPTGGSAPTASQIAAAVWTDTTAGDFATVGSPGKAVIDNLNATVGSRSTYAGGPVASVTAPVTVGTNNDKAGYALTTAEHTAIVADATAALGAAIPGSPTAGSIFDRIDAKVSSRMATFSYTAPDNAGILAAVATRQATLGAVEHGEAFEKAFSLMFSTVISGKTNGPAAGFAGTFIVTEGVNQRVSAPVTADGYRTTAPTLTAP